MEIKNLKLKNPYFLAPLDEINDIAFRLLCKKAGCSLTYIGLVNPLTKKKLILKDKPAIQLSCNSTKGIKQFIKKYDKKVSLWDFNLGCPSNNAQKNKTGVFMHPNKKLIKSILKTMRESTKKPITIKLRKSPHALEIAKIAEEYCDAIAIHPRTQKQGYSGKPDFDLALKLKKSSKVPIIYSGNVNEKNAISILKKFDFVMLGREAIGNPNIFAKLTNKKSKIKFKDYLKLAKKYKLYFKQIKSQAMKFTKSKPNAKQLRKKLISSKSVYDVRDVFGI